MFIVEVRGYVYIVPFVEDEEKYFLKTIYPSSDATKKYLKERWLIRKKSEFGINQQYHDAFLGFIYYILTQNSIFLKSWLFTKISEIEMKYLNKEEKDFIESFKKDEWKPIKKNDQKTYVKAAKESLAKNKRINIRLTLKDYHDIQVKAIEEGIPYQTLISSLIHKYNKGELKST